MKRIPAILLAAVLMVSMGRSQTFTSLFSFNGTNGANPEGSLVMGPDGYLYGATTKGGTNGGYGTLFRISTNGVFTSMMSFTSAEGSQPQNLTLGPDGNFYGTTHAGAANNFGNIFQFTTGGTWTPWLIFGGSYGWWSGPLTVGRNGILYGTTYEGGNPTFNDGEGAGIVYSITTGDAYGLVAWFDETNGELGGENLVQGSDGNFYGPAFDDGAYEAGTIFKSTNGLFTSIFSFNEVSNGAGPTSLSVGPDGNFYGTTQYGTTNVNIEGLGTLFKLTTNGVLTTLLLFNGTNGASPEAPMVLAPDGNFYGTTLFGGTNNYGVIFRLTTNGTMTPLVELTNDVHGGLLYGGLTPGPGGTLYGMTTEGGTNGDGTIFVLNLASPITNPIPLGAYLINRAIVLSWTNSAFKLQSAPALTGAYTTVAGAASPYTNALSGSQQYFRLSSGP
jgi:uncharacterized repeat protein (TIGR03803 family)